MEDGRTRKKEKEIDLNRCCHGSVTFNTLEKSSRSDLEVPRGQQLDTTRSLNVIQLSVAVTKWLSYST
jgi:hypothetical protein